MPIWLQAGRVGPDCGQGPRPGALIAWLIEVPQRIAASVMAFGVIPKSWTEAVGVP
jgi:hypothetical protein